jgi:hypothetical protein
MNNDRLQAALAAKEKAAMEKMQDPEALSKMAEEELEHFKPIPVDTMNHSERKRRLKYFKKMMKDHEKRKPSINIHEENEEKQAAAIMRMQRWATRYGILMKKVYELGIKQNHKGLHQPRTEESEPTTE